MPFGNHDKKGWHCRVTIRQTMAMTASKNTSKGKQDSDATARLRVAMHLQALEGNPLDAEEVALFEMFEREGWSHERRLAFLRDQAIRVSDPDAAE